jgi:hypothetical protein
MTTLTLQRAAVADGVSTGLAILAVAGPLLLAFNLPPSSTLLGQVLSFGAWGLWLAFGIRRAAPFAATIRATRGLSAMFGLLAGAAAWSWAFDVLPFSLAASSVGLIVMAWLTMLAGAACAIVPVTGSLRAAAEAEAEATSIESVFAAFAWGMTIAGALSAVIAAIQVFRPEWADGTLIARSGLPGRAVGNVRQPNHLASISVWSIIALVFLIETGRLARWIGALLASAMLLAVLLSASRTGWVGVAILVLWGLFDRRLSKFSRGMLLVSPFAFWLGWMAMAEWAHHTSHVFGSELRLGEADLSASRSRIWSNTLALIRAHPWTGVGWGEFNFAWSLSVFPDRPVAFFDHTHNLPLQLAVELGLPLAALVLGLGLQALWQGLQRAWSPGYGRGADGAAVRTAFVMVLMIGAHSLVEYPLWYAYFLLPAAFAWGCTLRPAPLAEDESGPYAARRARAARRRVAPSAWPLAAGVGMAIAAAGTVLDYVRVSTIFAPPPKAASLEQRIAQGRHSVLFAHHADYAAATSIADPNGSLEVFDGPSHYLLDTRLMIAWAEALAAHNDLDRARHIAARLREFRNPAADAFFATCQRERKPPEPAPFQCEPPTTMLGWQDFK